MGLENILKRTTTIQLDKERHMFFSMRGCAYLDQKYEGGLSGILTKLSGLSQGAMPQGVPDMLIDVIFASLMWEDKSLTRDDVGNMIDMNDAGQLVAKAFTATQSNMPDPKPQEDGGPTKESRN